MKVDKIILHHSLTADNKRVSWGAIRNYHMHTKGWHDIGYHYGIELIGAYYEVLVGRFEDQDGAHTIGQNTTAIGICFVGNFDIAPVSKEQWEKGLRLVVSLLRRYKSLTPFDVYGHRDFAQKSCPGLRFDVDAFRKQL